MINDTRRLKHHTLLYSKSQHLTCLSSPAENKYGWRGLTATPRTVLTWPVSDNFNVPDAKSQICAIQYTVNHCLSCHHLLACSKNQLSPYSYNLNETHSFETTAAFKLFEGATNILKCVNKVQCAIQDHLEIFSSFYSEYNTC